MKVTDIMKNRMLFSFEVFPPKTPDGMEKLTKEGGVLDDLYQMEPDYISCTYGAGGTNVGLNLEVLKAIKASGKTIPMTHFTCIGNTKEGMKQQLQTYLDNGIDHVLALRGDLPYGWTGTNGDLHYATELVKFIRQEYGDKFTIAVSGSPEGHIASRSLRADITYLKQKQDMGADYIMTQLCWDLTQFERWLELIRRAGITMPIDVGIMPVLSPTAVITQSLSRNGSVIPRDLARLLTKYWIFPNPFAPTEEEDAIKRKLDDFRKAGIEYTIGAIDRYRLLDIDGLHIYSLNKAEDVMTLVKDSGIRDII